MADSFIRLPADGVGKQLDTENLTVNAQSVHRERIQLAGDVDVAIAQILATDPSALDYGVVTRPAPPDSIQTSHNQSTATAAGATDDIDSAQINAGKTAKLMELIVTSTVWFKAELYTVQNTAETGPLRTIVGGPGYPGDLTPITKEAYTVAQDAGAGFDGFRVKFTNLDTTEPADGYCSFVYDEV